MPAVLLAGAAVATAAGAGIAAYGSYQQGKNAERIGNYNAVVQKQQNDLEYAMAKRQHELNAAALQTERNQTAALDQQGQLEAQRAIEQNRRTEEERRRLMATQRAGYAKAGVLMEGSPLALLADTAGLYEMQTQDTFREADLKGRALAREAELRRHGLLTDEYLQKLQIQGAKAAHKIGISQANLTKAQGMAAAQGYRYQAAGTLLQGAGQAASMGAQAAKK